MPTKKRPLFNIPIAAIAAASIAGTVQAESRRVVLLDGRWQVAEGKLDRHPSTFDHTVSVPGLLDMAEPPFEMPGSTVSAADRGSPWLRPADPRRDAFWYRRTFRVDGPLPESAFLKVNKARYGTKVFVNGQVAGEHEPNFTPGWFDVRPYLKGDGAENELVIRVGASLAQVPLQRTDGWDNEKSRYIPGIYDSVELILCGSPRVVNVQVVPNLAKSAARVVVELAGKGQGKARLTVRDAKSGREAGKLEAILPATGGKLDVTVPVPNAHLWTPEDPFLYELTVETGGDSHCTRFGMRSFASDPASGRLLLNGRPYFLRGSNVCIYRFFEDSARASLPWDETWVRTLHRKFKEMHWNSLRYCIGFPPEMWYRIADEEGILIQDEFPIWYSRAKGGWPVEITPDHLAVEYTEWMRERWNHPCVVIWDAQNETANDEVTRAAIGMVRGLDLSDRPWDNGWGSPQRPGDISECHPYRSSGKTWTLADLAKETGIPNNGPRKGTAAPPYLINEYGWLWINRDGSLPTLTVEVYQRSLGENATVEQRRHYYARTLAAKTEFWRSRRQCAGVLHFCGLGYSRPDGQTSDHFIDVAKLTYEPEFFRYVRDAFAPVGLMLDYWTPELAPNSRHAIRAIVINDLYADCQGTVRLRLMQGETTTAESTQPVKVAALGQATVTFDLAVPDLRGPCTLDATLTRDGTEPVHSLRDVNLVRPRPNLAIGRPVTASSEARNKQGYFPAKLAVDGKMDTRWSSEFKDSQWICVKLDGQPTVSGVELAWEKARSARYVIEVSSDGSNWKEVAHQPAQLQAVEKLEFAPISARFLRVRCLKRATDFGVSLYELRVFPPVVE